MHRAVVADVLGPIRNYCLRHVESVPLGRHDVQIAIKAAGVSFVDVLVAAGRYQVKPPVPFTPGSECAGIVTAIGTEVTGLSVGQAVMATGWRGIFAECSTLSASEVSPVPDGIPLVEASVLAVSYTTAWHGLVDRAQLREGETLLVLGAGGATGHAAIQVGAHLGARIIACTSSEAKHANALDAGAHAVVDSRTPDWRDAVRRANAGKPVDVVFDPVGGETTSHAFRALAMDGRHLVVGFPAGIASLPTNLPLLNGASLVGVNLALFSEAAPERARANRSQVIKVAAEGKFKPAIARTYPLEQFAQAMEAASTGESAGRIVLTMN